MDVCPTGTLAAGDRGYRVLLAGKLGRHPRLAEELPGIYQEDEVVSILEGCLGYYRKRSKHGERFADIYQDAQSLGLPLITLLPLLPLHPDFPSQNRLHGYGNSNGQLTTYLNYYRKWCSLRP
jgi:hypothetical protein